MTTTTVRAVLVGMPGTGKTSVGRRLAELLEVPFRDSDELVVQAQQRSVSDIFATDGEAAFRVMEAQAVTEALRSFDGVLALGGGAITTVEVRQRLIESGAPVVLLKTGVSSLLRRVGQGHDRPLLRENPQARLEELAVERESLYRQVATVTVDTERRSVARVAAVVAHLVHDGGALAHTESADTG